jgi:hypothetical protein
MKRAIVGICIAASFLLPTFSRAQSPQPYPNAVTDRGIHPKTAMLPPAFNVPFTDPDFGSRMVRATNRSTNYVLPGSYLITESSGQHNEWSADSSKFFVLGKGGQTLVLGFDPATMKVSSLPTAQPGKALLAPLQEPTFSSFDPDLLYGTSPRSMLTIVSYRFSTGEITPIIDTTKCGTRPALVGGPGVYSESVTVSADDNRFVIDEGGPAAGREIFVVAYDKALGCRWYNTVSGEIGGQWGPSGFSPHRGFTTVHAYLSKSGNYVRIMAYDAWYVWDLATMTVKACNNAFCLGYGAVGYDSYVNAAVTLDGFQIVKRPLSNLNETTELNTQLKPHNWGQNMHLSWPNADVSDSTPFCASSYMPSDEGKITKPFEGEIFCVETDGHASTIWRFAHNRAISEDDDDREGSYYYNTQPLGNISTDGRFFLFTSDWDGQLGTQSDGTPRSDVWIVKLD